MCKVTYKMYVSTHTLHKYVLLLYIHYHSELAIIIYHPTNYSPVKSVLPVSPALYHSSPPLSIECGLLCQCVVVISTIFLSDLLSYAKQDYWKDDTSQLISPQEQNSPSIASRETRVITTKLVSVNINTPHLCCVGE